MSTTAVTFADSEISMRYGALYVSAEFNSKFAGTAPKGIYAGYGITPSVTAQTVTITADTNTNNNIALVETSTGFSLSVKRTGNFSIDLSAFASKTVVIAIEASYALSATTSATIEVYELAPSDTFSSAPERNDLVVLGTVIVPATAIVVPSTDISYDYRDFAWQNKARSLVDWRSVARNGSFERSLADTAALFASMHWELYSETGYESTISSAVPRTGNFSYLFTITDFSTGLLNDDILKQKYNISTFEGATYRLRFYIKCVKAATSGGVLHVSLLHRQEDGDAIQPVTCTADVELDAVDADFRLVELTFKNTTPQTLYSLEFNVDATYGSNGAGFYIDDVELFVENDSAYTVKSALDHDEASLVAGSLLLGSNAAPALYTGDYALMYYNEDAPYEDGGAVYLERRDQDSALFPPTVVPKGGIVLGEDLLGTEAKALLPRITTKYTTSGSIDYTLIWEAPSSSGLVLNPRLYVTNTGHMFFTTNASWNGTTWIRDISGGTSSALELLPDGLYSYQDYTGGASFSNFAELSFSALSSNSDANFITNIFDFGVEFTQLLDFQTPRLKFQSYAIGTATRTLLALFNAADASNGSTRLYVTSTGNIEFVKNADWNGTTWDRDFAGNATKLLFNGSALTLFIRLSADSDGWTDTAWSTSRGATGSYTLDISDGTLTSVDGIYKVTAATIATGGSNPVNTVATTNELRAKNIPKSFGIVALGAAPAIIGTDGFNFASTSATSGTTIRCTFAAPMLTTTYFVSLTLDGSGLSTAALIPWVVDKQTTYFEFSVLNTSSVAQTLTSGLEYMVGFSVFGAQ